MGPGRTEVEHSKHNPRVEGSNLATDNRREKRAKIGGCHYLSKKY